jgi:serine/threonine protein kinase
MVSLNDPLGLAGTTLAGKYDVRELIADSDFSVVYRAYHRIWRHPVAIKAFRFPTLAENERHHWLEAFVSEGALLTDLSERGAAVRQARDVGSVISGNGEWVPFLVLEWLEGETLDIVLARERERGSPPRTVAQAIELLDPVARALSLAHERRIVHRDIKPGNVFMLAHAAMDGSACKLIDFGGAKVIGTVDEPRRESGVRQLFTPGYAAPEQFLPGPGRQGEPGATGPWTDVFALALVFVEIVTGRTPRQGETVAALALSAWNPEARPTPRTLGGDVSDEVERVVGRAVALSPRFRYPDARAFWSALCAARDSRPAVVPTVSVALARRRHASRTRWVAPALALLTAVVGGTLVAEHVANGSSATPSAVSSGVPAPATRVRLPSAPPAPAPDLRVITKSSPIGALIDGRARLTQTTDDRGR